MMENRVLVLVSVLVACCISKAYQLGNGEPVLERIAFGSCNNPKRPAMWPLINHFSPNRVILLGDTMYADKEPGGNVLTKVKSSDAIGDLYQEVKDSNGFNKLFPTMLATIDDHDYGENNGDKYFKFKEQSQHHFWNFIGEPEDSPRRKQNAVYTASTFTVAKNSSIARQSFTYKVILLDSRSNKDAEYSRNGDFLGEEQWSWLESELALSREEDKDVDLIIIGSSVQVLPTDKLIEEGWAEFPRARERLLRLVAARLVDTDVILLSGDVHSAEILRATCRAPSSAPSTSSSSESTTTTTGADAAAAVGAAVREEALSLWELTSSGLSHTYTHLVKSSEDLLADTLLLKVPASGHSAALAIRRRGIMFELVYNFYQAILPARYRQHPVADHYQGPHFALIDIIDSNSAGHGRKAVVSVIDHDGEIVIQRQIPLRARKSESKGTSTSNPSTSTGARREYQGGAWAKAAVSDSVSKSGGDIEEACQPFWGPTPLWRRLTTRAAIALSLLVFILTPLVSVIWLSCASGYYVLFGAEKERRRIILESNAAAAAGAQ